MSHMWEKIQVSQIHEKNYLKKNFWSFMNTFSSFSDPQYVKKHVKIVHENVKNFKCGYSNCGKSFGTESLLDYHKIQYHEPDKKIKCDFCDKKINPHNLKIHVSLVHEKLRKYKCNQCEKSFKTKRQLADHIPYVHEGLKQYQCQKCDKSFGYEEGLKMHVSIIHFGEKKFHCQCCGKSFGRSSHLNRHILDVHKDVKKSQQKDL